MNGKIKEIELKKDDSLMLLQVIPGFFEYDDSNMAFDISIPFLKAISLKVLISKFLKFTKSLISKRLNYSHVHYTVI